MLLTHGRLGLPQIIRLTHLKPRLIRASILVLVQHNLLWHAQSDDEGEVFEINADECLMRLRYGRYVWLAEQLHGKSVSPVQCNGPLPIAHTFFEGCRHRPIDFGPWQAPTSRYYIPPLNL